MGSSRYTSADIIANARKIENDKEVIRRRFSTTLMPKIPERSTDVYVYARAGDRLDLLAKEYYGDPALWWYIAQANGVGKGTYHVETGTLLRIPGTGNSIDLYFDYEEFNQEVEQYNDKR